jgi:L-ascorbate oxidase
MTQKSLAVGFGVAALLAVAMASASPAVAGTYSLTIDKSPMNISGTERPAMTVNGQVPGPTLRFKEGEDVTINVTNKMDVDTSIHWHGILLPYTQDGVPGISFPGIKPGETFTYRFKIKQSGTYWYHSHSGLQEQAGVYGPLIIEPAKREPYRYDREHVVMLSDWTDEKPERVLSNLKKQSDYYNYSQRTVGTFFRDIRKKGWSATMRDRLDWGNMRMTPTDIADVTGYSFLVNGQNPAKNWTGLFKPGERVRLRFINGSAMTFFDVRIPGLKMVVVQADGNDVLPTVVDEFRIAVAETYDVIVHARDDRAYTIFAESLDRTGYARGTLAPRKGMSAEVPKLRPRPLLTMADMGMAHGDMGHGDMGQGSTSDKPQSGGQMAPHKMGKMPKGMPHGTMGGSGHAPAKDMKPGAMGAPDHGAMKGMGKGMEKSSGHGAMSGMRHGSMAGMEHGSMAGMKSGLTHTAANGGKVLVYGDLRAMKPYGEYKAPDRVIELKLTGNMERYFWSINGKKYSEAEPIRLKLGERVRFKFVNTTMMSHPMHLHGMWMLLDVGKGKYNPLKHVVNVAPGTTLNVDIPVDAKGQWAFHCHLLYHMATGMFRKVIVGEDTASLEPAGAGR